MSWAISSRDVFVRTYFTFRIRGECTKYSTCSTGRYKNEGICTWRECVVKRRRAEWKEIMVKHRGVERERKKTKAKNIKRENNTMEKWHGKIASLLWIIHILMVWLKSLKRIRALFAYNVYYIQRSTIVFGSARNLREINFHLYSSSTQVCLIQVFLSVLFFAGTAATYCSSCTKFTVKNDGNMKRQQNTGSFFLR